MGSPKILAFTYAFPPHYSGGGEQARQLLVKLRDRGLRTQVLSFHPHRKPRDGIQRGTVSGIPVDRIPLGGDGQLDRAYRQSMVLRFLWRHRDEFDILHVHGIGRQALPALALAKTLGKATVGKVALMGADDPESLAEQHHPLVLRGLLNLLDRLVAISSEVEGAFRRVLNSPDRVVSIPNGVDTAAFKPPSPDERASARKRLGLPTDRPILVFVGVVNRRKGFDTLEQAWLKLIQNGSTKDPLLLVVGPATQDEARTAEPKLADRFEDRLRNLDADRTLRIEGLVDDVTPYLAAADGFVFPSRREGLPNSLLEALAMGLPTIASRLPCIEDVVTHGEEAILVPPGDPNSLHAAMESLLDGDRSDRLARNARARVQKAFSLDSVADSYVELYDLLLEEKS